jgi:hypothetical protein
MDTISREQLRQLAQVRDECVSVYMPTHRSGKDNEQDHIRLKNLIRQAQEKLAERGMRAPEARDLMEPAQELVADSPFWQHQSDGLALFLRPGGIQRYRVPLRFQEEVAVGPRFQLLPLFPLVNDDEHFYVLAFSPKLVRLLECTHYSVEEADVPEMPRNYDDFARFIDEEKSLQLHSQAPPVAPPRGGLGGIKRRAAMYHGQGGGGDDADKKMRLMEYCQLIDRAVAKKLATQTSPLVLACDTSLAGIYPDVNSYDHLFDEDFVPGNPDGLREKEIRDRAWKLLEPKLEEIPRKALDEFGLALTRNRATDRLEEVLPAAYDGRVDRLLVQSQSHRWGNFDPEQRTLTTDNEPAGTNEDLLNVAATETLLHNGDVYVLPVEEMPEQAAIAAIYRY